MLRPQSMEFSEKALPSLFEQLPNRKRELFATLLLSLFGLEICLGGLVFFLDHRAQQMDHRAQQQLMERQSEAIEELKTLREHESALIDEHKKLTEHESGLVDQQKKLLEQQGEIAQREANRPDEVFKRLTEAQDRIFNHPKPPEPSAEEQARINELKSRYWTNGRNPDFPDGSDGH